MAVIEPIDEVHITRAATAGTNGDLAGEMCFRARCERPCLLIPHVKPRDFFPLPDCIRKPVERIAHYAVDSGDTSLNQSVDKYFRYFLSHKCTSLRKKYSFSNSALSAFT